jgi:hypothetical protein
MSPEVLDGRGYEWKSDIWSLGCLLYELATLRSPFKGQGDKDNLYSLFKKISSCQFAQLPAHHSEHLRSLVGSMIQTDPNRRPDIAQTLQAAVEATAHFAGQAAAAAAAMGAAAGGGGGGDSSGGGNGGAVDCAVLIDAVLDKLKILGYEAALLRPRGMPPLPRGYFTSATIWPISDQFRYVFRLVCWLAELGPLPGHDLWDRLPAHPSDFEAASAAAALVEALAGCGGAVGQAAAALPPLKLRSAHGAGLCGLLNVLADEALAARGFGWAKPSHGVAEGEGLIEEQSGEREAEEGSGSGGRRSPRGSGAGRCLRGESGDALIDEAIECERAPSVGLPRLLPILQSSIDPGAWQQECERCAPVLKVKISWRQLHWRHRLELAGKRAPEMAEALSEAGPGLEAVGQRAGDDAAAMAPLLRKQSELGAEAERRETDGAAAQARVDALAAQLRLLGEQLDETKRGVEEIAGRIGDRSGVGAVAAACSRLRVEAAKVAMRTAMAQRELMRHRLRAGRRVGPEAGDAGGEGERGGEEESWEAG